MILMVALEKMHIKDVLYGKDLVPLKKKFQLTMLRGQDKNTFVRALANSLFKNGYVHVAMDDGAELKNLRREDIKKVKPVKDLW